MLFPPHSGETGVLQVGGSPACLPQRWLGGSPRPGPRRGGCSSYSCSPRLQPCIPRPSIWSERCGVHHLILRGTDPLLDRSLSMSCHSRPTSSWTALIFAVSVDWQVAIAAITPASQGGWESGDSIGAFWEALCEPRLAWVSTWAEGRDGDCWETKPFLLAGRRT